MKFCIIGSALSGNKGAASMLVSSIELLTDAFPNCQITLLSMYPTADNKLNSYSNLKIVNAKPLRLGLLLNPICVICRILPFTKKFFGNINHAIKALLECNLILDQSGISFSDGRELYLIYNLAILFPGIFLKKKIVKCSQALGPFNSPLNRLAAKFILPKLKLIIARGAITYEFLRNIGLKNVVLGMDLAFSMKNNTNMPVSILNTIECIKRQRSMFIGIAPSTVTEKKCQKNNIDYISVMSEFIDYLSINYSATIVLLPHCVRLNTKKTHNNDLSIVQAIYKKLENKEQCILPTSDYTAQELRQIISQCDFFISSRFHAMISALTTYIPCLILGWSHKYKEVTDVFEVSEFVCDYRSLQLDFLQAKFSELVKFKSIYKEKLLQHHQDVVDSSRSFIEHIERVIQS